MIAHVIPAQRGTLRLAWFDYFVPSELEKIIAVGQLVKIPFRSAEIFGVIHSLAATPESPSKLKTLTAIVHAAPFLSPPQLAFLEEMALFFHVSLGFLVKMNLPPLSNRKLKSWEALEQKDQSETHKTFGKPRLFVYTDPDEKRNYFQTHSAEFGQTLILVPEVTQTTSIFNNLTPAQQTHSAIITGELSPKNLFILWQQMWTGEKTILLGTRRALFLPFFRLATIILDDEGNENHKSFDLAPRFHARDAAIMLAKHHGTAIHLLTHAPAVESYYFAKQKVYEIASDRLLPTIPQHYTLIDIKNDRRGGNFSALTLDLARAIHSAKKGTLFLFCHRRGTLAYVTCRDCKTVLTCPHCHESLAFHATTKTLQCHHCGFQEPMIATCAHCHGTNIALYGPGTEQVEREVKKLLQNDLRPIVVLDSDSAHTELNTASEQIIIGTHSAWPFIPWAKISLMAFIDSDTPLFVPEYKTGERLWQTITRSLFLLPESTPLFIQTAHPENTLFQALATPELFYTHELAERRLFRYPPYRFVLRLFTSGKNYSLLRREVEQVGHALQQLTKNDSTVTITPASDMFPRFQRGAYWQTIIIKIGYAHYKKTIKQLLTAVPETWKVDPNPNTLLSL